MTLVRYCVIIHIQLISCYSGSFGILRHAADAIRRCINEQPMSCIIGLLFLSDDFCVRVLYYYNKAHPGMK